MPVNKNALIFIIADIIIKSQYMKNVRTEEQSKKSTVYERKQSNLAQDLELAQLKPIGGCEASQIFQVDDQDIVEAGRNASSDG